MRNRRDYERALEVVGEVVRNWDPCGLLQSGMPDDEFDAEIAKVVVAIPRINSATDAARALSVAFSAAFEPESFPETSCAKPGVELYSRLVAAGLCTS